MLKRITILCISIFVGLIDNLLEIIKFLFRKNRVGKCIVLYYHGVPKSQETQFKHQMKYLQKIATPITADHEKPLKAGNKYVVITFDDGFTSVFENAIPILNHYKIPSTVFIPTGYLGKYPKWGIYNNNNSWSSKDMIISADKLQIQENNLLTIGSHSVTHVRLSRLGEIEMREELVQSKHELEEILEKSITLLSFPHGDYNQKLIQIARDLGYKRVFSVTPTLAFSQPDEYVTGRIKVAPTDWFLEFRLKVAGAYRWFPIISRIKTKYHRLLAISISK